MTEPPRYAETDDDSAIDYEQESASGIPRWVKVVGVVVAVLVLLVVVVMLVGGGGHRPRRHGMSTEPRRVTAATTAHGASPLDSRQWRYPSWDSR